MPSPDPQTYIAHANRIEASMSSANNPTVLSAREAEVLGSCSRGLSNQEIGDQLAVTEGTVKGHLVHIYRKLSVRNRTGAVAKARQLGLLKK
jgi:ATP/maltotriose-dependent transcriptional regulator MalT